MKFRVLVDVQPPEQVRRAAFRAALPGNRLRQLFRPNEDRVRMAVPLIIKASSTTDAAEIGVELVWTAAERVWGPGAWVPQTCGVRHTGIRAFRERNVSHRVDCTFWPPLGGGSGGDREPRRPAPSTLPPGGSAVSNALARLITRRPARPTDRSPDSWSDLPNHPPAGPS